MGSGVEKPGVEKPGVEESGVEEPGVTGPGVTGPGVKGPGAKEPGLKGEIEFHVDWLEPPPVSRPRVTKGHAVYIVCPPGYAHVHGKVGEFLLKGNIPLL